MSTPAHAEPGAGVPRAVPSDEAGGLLASRPDLLDRLRDGDPAALAEFFEARGATVESVREVAPGE